MEDSLRFTRQFHPVYRCKFVSGHYAEGDREERTHTLEEEIKPGLDHVSCLFLSVLYCCRRGEAVLSACEVLFLMAPKYRGALFKDFACTFFFSSLKKQSDFDAKKVPTHLYDRDLTTSGSILQ